MCMYGSYVVTTDKHIEEAKEALLEQAIDLLREIAQDDNFWIVKKNERNEYSVAWKIRFPQMDK